MTKHMVETYNGHTWYKQVDFTTGALVGRGQSELAVVLGRECSAHAGETHRWAGPTTGRGRPVLNKYPGAAGGHRLHHVRGDLGAATSSGRST